jgi:hypothetical protein
VFWRHRMWGSSAYYRSWGDTVALTALVAAFDAAPDMRQRRRRGHVEMLALR